MKAKSKMKKECELWEKNTVGDVGTTDLRRTQMMKANKKAFSAEKPLGKNEGDISKEQAVKNVAERLEKFFLDIAEQTGSTLPAMEYACVMMEVEGLADIAYEQGKKDALDGRCIEIPPSTVEAWIDVGRKQTLSEVLKWINDNWTEHRSFGFSIKEHLEQKLRETE